ncbi:hypothetical protein ACTOB_004395 [Actinoplanes oblitus]|uniref:GerMN domain-containing protein n=1 Tax=Actinoplanes oblitus TaxID=3040509 RepID=A0ABY8W3Q8_9ACTN|nr:hypothetical protein [Actinoplanes oblitus]WIM92455.1 hypothetical protein ACTOB_004395 [Actinoplanes oblitus]
MAKRARRNRPRRRTEVPPGTVASKRSWLTAKGLALLGIVVTAVVGSGVALAVQRLDAADRRRTQARVPLLVVTADYAFADDAGEVWALPRAVSAAGAGRLVQQFDDPAAWRANIVAVARAEGGTKLGQQIDGAATSITPIRIALTTTVEDTVLVEDITARTLACADPPRASIIFAGSQGVVATARMSVEIDTGNHQAVTEESGAPRRPYFDERFLTVGRADPQVVTVDAVTRRQACTWELVITASAGQRRQSVPVRLAGGRPMRSSAWVRDYGERFLWTDGLQLSRLPAGTVRPDIPS